MGQMKIRQSPRNRQFDDDTEDLRSYIGSGGVGPMFDDITDMNGVTMSSNAHDERCYEDMRRMPDQRTYISEYGDDGSYAGTRKILSDPPMSLRVKNQVFSSIGCSAGTMTSASLFDDGKGDGLMGADGGVQGRAQIRPSDLYLKNKAKGR